MQGKINTVLEKDPALWRCYRNSKMGYYKVKKIACEYALLAITADEALDNLLEAFKYLE